MANTRVNASSISATSTSGSAYSTTYGVTLNVGDLVVVTAACNGTRVANGMSCSDAVNGAFTTLLETQFGTPVTSKWEQTFYLVVTSATASATSITVTPYASSTQSTFAVDVFRGASGLITGPAVGSQNGSSTSPDQPPLASAPVAGDLVLGFCQPNGGTITVPTGYTEGSKRTGGTPNACIAYVLSADGSSTYGANNWTIGSTNPSATQIVAFSQQALSGSASLTGTATLAAAGGGSSAPTVSATATLSASGQVAATANATTSITATLTAAGSTTYSTSATESVAATIAAAASVAAAPTLTTTATVVATGSTGRTPSATEAVAASVAATAGGTSSPTETATATVSASGVVGRSTSATQTVTATLAATGVLTAPGVAPVTVAATLSASGAVGLNASAAVTATSARTATGAAASSPALAPVATIAASGVLAITGAAHQAIAATGSAAGSTGTASTVSATVTATITATGTVGSAASAPVAFAVTLTATGTLGSTRDVSVTATLTGSDWSATLADSSWSASLTPSLWKAVLLMATFVHGSVEYVTVTVTADVTLSAQPVAISVDSGETWQAAAWQGSSGTTREARTVEPVTFQRSQSGHRVLVKVTDTPEIPVADSGRVKVT